MLKKNLTVATLLLLILFPTCASSQELPVGKWWRTPHIVEQLNLIDEQLIQLDALFVESTHKLRDLKHGVEKEQFELKILLEKNTLDEDGIMKQVRKLEKERALLNEERVRIIVKTRRIIGYEAFSKLKDLVEKRAKDNVNRHINTQNPKTDHQPSHHPPQDNSEF